MQEKWEYKIVKSRRLKKDLNEERLNELGMLGWELISQSSYDRGSGMSYTFKKTKS
ncbi:MAG: DUF4177 domain-containing protein [Mycoplasmataceae bacterium]|nr:DUF4177 domain-containing protein [Mycoplasmataceae bacterium]